MTLRATFLCSAAIAFAWAGVAAAQDEGTPPGLPPGYDTEPYSDGEIARQRAEWFLRGLLAEIDPALRRLRDTLEGLEMPDHGGPPPPGGDRVPRRAVPDVTPGAPPLPMPDPFAPPAGDAATLI